MSNDLVARQEDVSSKLLSRRFASYAELAAYLDSSGLEYLLKEDRIGGEPPTSKSVQWDRERPMRYLLLLPKDPRKLFRFRIYETQDGGLHLEGDFAYKNPYQ